MTSRERVLAAIDHREPDRVPVSFAGSMSSGILECPPNGRGYSKLCRHLGITDFEEPDYGFMNNFVSNVDERALERLRSDFRRIDANPPEAVREKDGSVTVLGVYCGLRVRNSGVYDDVFEYPLSRATTLEDIRRYPYWPTAEDFRKLSIGKAREAAELRGKSDCAIVVDTFLIFPFLMYPLLTGYEKWFVDMKCDERFYFALADRLMEIGLEIVDSYLCEVGPYIDIVATYDDVGTQRGLLCSKEDYRHYIRPYEERMIAQIRKHTRAAIYRHSCGSVFDIIPDFIEMGVQILNPVQPLAAKMEPWRLKREFGKDLCFFGGVDTQRLLPNATVEEVRDAIGRLIEEYGPGGGFILAPSTNIEPDTPPENIVATYDAAFELGSYPVERGR